MRKIILFIASSLEGYIARKNGEIDWLFTDQDYGYNEFFQDVDTVLMGNRTYQQILGFGDYPYPGKQSFVFSQIRQGHKDKNVEFIGNNWLNFVDSLRHNRGKNIWLVGGGKTIHNFLLHDLIDEIILSIHPLILGEGIPLIISDPNCETKLQLKQVKTYDSGLLQVFYDLKH